MAQKRKRPKSLYRRMKDSAQVQAAFTVILPVLLGIVIIALWQTQVHSPFHSLPGLERSF